MTDPIETPLSRPVADMDPAELELRRRTLVAQISSHPGGTDDAPLDWLRELAAVTSALRRRTAGPPKRPRTTTGTGSACKGPKGAPKSVGDLLDLL